MTRTAYTGWRLPLGLALMALAAIVIVRMMT